MFINPPTLKVKGQALNVPSKAWARVIAPHNILKINHIAMQHVEISK